MNRTLSKYKWPLLGGAIALYYYGSPREKQISKKDLREKINATQIAINMKAQAFVNAHGTVGLEEYLHPDAVKINAMKDEYLTRFGEEWAP